LIEACSTEPESLDVESNVPKPICCQTLAVGNLFLGLAEAGNLEEHPGNRVVRLAALLEILVRSQAVHPDQETLVEHLLGIHLAEKLLEIPLEQGLQHLQQARSTADLSQPVCLYLVQLPMWVVQPPGLQAHLCLNGKKRLQAVDLRRRGR